MVSNGLVGGLLDFRIRAFRDDPWNQVQKRELILSPCRLQAGPVLNLQTNERTSIHIYVCVGMYVNMYTLVYTYG